MTEYTLDIVYNKIRSLSDAQKDFLVSELIGEFLEETNSRFIFEYKKAPDMIIKVDKFVNTNNYNKREYEISNYLLKISFDRNIIEAKKWFAYIEGSWFDSKIILQERGCEIRTYGELPDSVPSFMKGIKRTELECRKGNIVIRDYYSLDVEKIMNYNGKMISKNEIIDLNDVECVSTPSHSINSKALNNVLSRR